MNIIDYSSNIILLFREEKEGHKVGNYFESDWVKVKGATHRMNMCVAPWIFL